MFPFLEELTFVAAQVLYLFAPLLFAAALSGLVLRLNLLSAFRRPLDGGVYWQGRRLLGESKTWRGVIVAVAGCIAGVWLQKLTGARTAALWLLDYRALNPLSFGTAMGNGATAGELPTRSRSAV